MLTAIVASPTRTNVLLADAWRALGVNACVVSPNEALEELRDGDIALFRLDVLPTLDGVEPGLEIANTLERHGTRVLNRPLSLLAESVVAGAERTAAWGEWRTNVSLGGRVRPARLPRVAQELGVQAARAIGIDFAGVDLLPLDGSWIVLELNGAVDFDARYTLMGRDPYAATLDALDIGRREAHASSGVLQSEREEETMVKTVTGKPARPGDEILITGHSVGDSPRTAVIEEVLGEPGHERFRVRWEDGHESIYFPGEDAVLRRPRRAPTKSTA